MAHQDGVLEVERLDHGGKIVGIPVHVVRRRGLTRPAMTTTVVRDHTEALLREEEHLAVPSVRAQGPVMRERYDRTLTPIFVINLCCVFGGDRAHCKPFLLIGRFCASAGLATAIKDSIRRRRCAKKPDVCESSEYIGIRACHPLTFERTRV